MQLLFETFAYRDGVANHYRIYKTADNDYLARLINTCDQNEFHLNKINGKWVASELRQQRQAEQIGQVIDSR